MVEGAIGPLDDYCDGYADPGSSGASYVSVLKVSTGTAPQSTDATLEEIVSLSRAETNGAYAGQINAINTSSTSWLSGLVWGYDIARHDGLINGSVRPLMKRQRRDGTWIPVYSAAPLLEAGEALFGTSTARHFPLAPGSHILCATKDVVASGPIEIWSAIAFAIAEDRNENSNLFIEDAGHGMEGESRHEQEGLLHDFHRVNDIVDSVILCGDDQNVKFKEVFVGYKSRWVPEGRVGCALACVPYLVLARNAAPRPATDLLTMSLAEWELFVAPQFEDRGLAK
jgi:histidine decarboxylase